MGCPMADGRLWRAVGQISPAPLTATQNELIAAIQQGYKNQRQRLTARSGASPLSAGIIHFPADKHWQMPIGKGFCYDSYSGSDYLNGEDHANANTILKRTGVLHPSDRWIWIESSDSRGENEGAWWMNFAGNQANGFQGSTFADGNDAPAAYHITSANFNFCDGHAESHKWLNGETINLANARMAHHRPPTLIRSGLPSTMPANRILKPQYLTQRRKWKHSRIKFDAIHVASLRLCVMKWYCTDKDLRQCDLRDPFVVSKPVCRVIEQTASNLFAFKFSLGICVPFQTTMKFPG